MIRPAAVIALLALSLAPLAPAAGQNVLRVKPFGDVKMLDTTMNPDAMVRAHGYLVYDTLFALDAGNVVRPQMVESWTTSADGLVWVFTLRPGMAFHDGAPVTAADVVASLQRWVRRDGFGQQLALRTAAMAPLDPMRVQITLKAPWGLVLDALAKPGGSVPFIMPARIASGPADKLIDDPTGSGPFVMKRDEWLAGDRIVYTRNVGYVPRAEPASGLAGGKRPGFDRFEYRVLPDSQTALAALIRGEIDIFEEIPPDLLPLLKNRPEIKVARTSDIGPQQALRMNQVQPPFNNVKLRQAVSYAIDPEAFLRALNDDTSLVGRACPSFFTCTSPYFADVGWPKPDLEKARALVRESGYDGTPVVLLDPVDVPLSHYHVVLANAVFQSIGLKTDLQAMDWGTLTARRVSKAPVDKGGWSVFITGPSGVDVMEPISHSAIRANCDRAFFGWACDAEIERIREAFADAVDPAERQRLAAALQRRALEVVPYWPVANLYLLRGYRSSLSGLLAPPAPAYWNVTRQ